MKLVSSIKTKLDSSELLQRIMKAIIFGIGGSVGSRVLKMISGVIISRILGKETYGQFSMVNSTVTLFVTFSGIGVGATLTRYVALYRQTPKKIGNIIGTLSTFVGLLSVIVSLFLLLFAEHLSFWVSGSDVLSTYFKITSFTIFFTVLGSIQQSILLGMEKYKNSAKIELVQYGIYVVLSGLLSAWKGINGAIWALLITSILYFLMLYVENKKEYMKNSIEITFDFNSEIKKIILHFTIPAFVSSLFVIPVNWINNIILTRNAGFGELAIFSVALQWLTMITYIPTQLGKVKPIYTDLYAQKNYLELKKIFKNITLSSTILITPIILAGIIFSKYILSIYGADYKGGYLTFILMMIASLLITMQSQIGALLQAIGKMWSGFILNLIWSIIIVTVFYYFKYLGSTGYAIAYCISYGIHTILSYGVIWYLWNQRRSSKEK